MTGSIRDAAEDLRYLLARGYQRTSAVRFVGDRYGLNKHERLCLYRCVYPRDVAALHSNKNVPEAYLGKASISVDGFNVLRTVYGALRGNPVFMCDDGFVRDVSFGYRKPTMDDLIEPLRIVLSHLASLNPRETTFVYDRPVSKSGMISKGTEDMMREKGLPGTSVTSPNPDTEVLKRGEVVATSDSVIIERARHVFDLGGSVVVNRLCLSPTKI